MISLKVAELRSRMWKRAALAGAVAAIPLPGVSLVMDIGIVTEESKFYFTQLGLDATSLKRYAELTKTDYQHLKAIVVSSFGTSDMRTVVDTYIKGPTMRSIPLLAGEGLKWIPVIGFVIGPLIAAPLSCGSTYNTLKLILEKVERVSLEVVECAAESAASACCDESDDDDDDP